MGKTRRGEKDYDQLDKLKNENRKLKRQISSLRKQIARIDLDRYHNIRELLEKYDAEEQEEELQRQEEAAKEEWRCHDCDRDYLRLVVFNRRDGTFYFRKCFTCGKRTKTQKYHDKVKGLK